MHTTTAIIFRLQTKYLSRSTLQIAYLTRTGPLVIGLAFLLQQHTRTTTSINIATKTAVTIPAMAPVLNPDRSRTTDYSQTIK